MTAPEQKFSGKAEIYAASRPSYPPELTDWISERCPHAKVADIGAGTGIFTRCLLRRYGDVTAVEPNADMREQFSMLLPQIRCIAASGEATGLPDHAFGLVTVAQAFHWLDENRFRDECRRILRPGGRLAIIWNNRSDTGIAAERNDICRAFCPDFRSGHAGNRTEAEGDRFLREEYFSSVEVCSFRNPFPMTEERFLGDASSRSYSLPPDHPDYRRCTDALREVFRRHASNGIAVEEYEAKVYLGTL